MPLPSSTPGQSQRLQERKPHGCTNTAVPYQCCCPMLRMLRRVSKVNPAGTLPIIKDLALDHFVVDSDTIVGAWLGGVVLGTADGQAGGGRGEGGVGDGSGLSARGAGRPGAGVSRVKASNWWTRSDKVCNEVTR